MDLKRLLHLHLLHLLLLHLLLLHLHLHLHLLLLLLPLRLLPLLLLLHASRTPAARRQKRRCRWLRQSLDRERPKRFQTLRPPPPQRNDR